MALHEHSELEPPWSAGLAILIISCTCRSRNVERKENERNERNAGKNQIVPDYLHDKGCIGEARGNYIMTVDLAILYCVRRTVSLEYPRGAPPVTSYWLAIESLET